MTGKIAEHGRNSQGYKTTDWLAYLVLRFVMGLIQTFSLERCDRICRLLAFAVCRWFPIRKKLLDSNLSRIFPAWSSLKKEEVQEGMWHHLFLMCCEIAQAARKIHRENWHEHFHSSDRPSLIRLLVDNRPVVLVSGHFGNFELAGFLTGLFGIDTTTIARPLDNGYVHDYVMGFRSLGGQHYLSNEGTSLRVSSILESGGKLALLADQHGGEKGCWVDFMGQPASCHKALALFTLSSGAPMIVCANTRRGKPLQFDMKMLGVADPKRGGEHLESVATLTRWYNQCLERAIYETPEQYWWVHRRWREPPARIAKRQAA
jgi:Kdo2-lipid IVA lauroyltransferase/acyltransferase